MIENLKIIKVGIADMNIVYPPCIIRTAGLGSCVGVVLYDQWKELAGMVHVMLPDSSLAKEGQLNVAKYADTGVKELVKRLQNEGAKTSMLKAKIAGGAQMFQFSSGNDLMRIGPRNVEAVKKVLNQLKIELIAEDCGGNNGRTIEFNPKTRLLTIRTVNKGVKEL
ncbi:chemotaxis protein CheD [Bacillus massiliigorillae]|uniref:chemotaxis protein CheD n=1 Tax=Bacillus massiliigorillae TaxID=1243664 RepID=UPI00039EAAFA|nr:chemotaxis protein CheD [Bacillus massiliigorillae]